MKVSTNLRPDFDRIEPWHVATKLRAAACRKANDFLISNPRRNALVLGGLPRETIGGKFRGHFVLTAERGLPYTTMARLAAHRVTASIQNACCQDLGEQGAKALGVALWHCKGSLLYSEWFLPTPKGPCAIALDLPWEVRA